MATYEDVLDVLGDATRRSILERLGTGPCAVVELARGLPVSRPAVSQHLRVLHDVGLVSYRADGNRNVYRLQPDGLRPLRAWLEEFWQGPLDSFRDFASAQAQAQAEAAETETGGQP